MICLAHRARYLLDDWKRKWSKPKHETHIMMLLLTSEFMSILQRWRRDAHIAATLEGNSRKVCNTSQNQKRPNSETVLFGSHVLNNTPWTLQLGEKYFKVHQISHGWRNDANFDAKKATFEEYSKVIIQHAINTDWASSGECPVSTLEYFREVLQSNQK